MRTTLDLDSDLVSALLAHHPNLTKTEAIEEAIRTYLEESAIERLRRRAGSLELVDISSDLRGSDRHT